MFLDQRLLRPVGVVDVIVIEYEEKNGKVYFVVLLHFHAKIPCCKSEWCSLQFHHKSKCV